MIAKKLYTRWATEHHEAFLHSLAAEMRRGRVSSPFGKTDEGRVDLRGARFPDKVSLARLKLAGVDLGGATMSGAWIEGCEFVDVVFDQVGLEYLHDHANVFKQCSFRETDLREAGIGYKGSRFERCTFERAKFRGCVFIHTRGVRRLPVF